MRKYLFFILAGWLAAPGLLFAGGAGTASGMTLLRAASARTAALGEAMTAATDDVAVMAYNPASLKSLLTAQASFLYDRGINEDTFGQFFVGMPSRGGSWGLSVGYYNAGSMDLTDENLMSNTVNAQTDLAAGLGYAQELGPLRWGLTGKYFSSKLADSYQAHAAAADVGIQTHIGSRLEIGAAAQNLGSKLNYYSQAYSLPRIYRAGAAWLLLPGRFGTTLFVDIPYHAVEDQWWPAAGLEVKAGPIALRGGYSKTYGLAKEFTAGVGLLVGPGAIDYSFGMIDQLNTEHRISLSLRFGSGVQTQSAPAGLGKPEQASVPTKESTPVVPVSRPTGSNSFDPGALAVETPGLADEAAGQPEVTIVQRVRPTLKDLDQGKATTTKEQHFYVVRPGDSLNKIALRLYGDERHWAKIFKANQNLFKTSPVLKVGQKLQIP